MSDRDLQLQGEERSTGTSAAQMLDVPVSLRQREPASDSTITDESHAALSFDSFHVMH